jgi:hypothetical protein
VLPERLYHVRNLYVTTREHSRCGDRHCETRKSRSAAGISVVFAANSCYVVLTADVRVINMASPNDKNR